MEAMLLHDRALAQIEEIGLKRHPSEACGILLPEPWKNRWVYELPNRSLTPQSSFAFLAEDVRLTLSGWFEERTTPPVEGELTIWHTHPGGGIGPSRKDMQMKVPGARFLVVAMTPEGAVPTWY